VIHNSIRIAVNFGLNDGWTVNIGGGAGARRDMAKEPQRPDPGRGYI